MYSIQNFAKWLNGRGVNGYKKFSKIIQIPNGEYVGFYVANVSSSAIGTWKAHYQDAIIPHQYL